MICLDKQVGADGSIKHLWQLGDGNTIESLYFLYEDALRTICVSTQVGCAVGCPFCETGKQGNLRNLTADEICGQVEATLADLGGDLERFDIVTLSGMGEPLFNFGAVRESVATLRARRLADKVSLTSVGVPARIRELATVGPVHLSLSLHATTDEVRDRLVPVNRKFPIADIVAAARDYHRMTGLRVTMNYLLFAGLNDGDDDLARLAALLDPAAFRVRVRQWNHISDAELVGSPRLAHFEERLAAAGFDVYISRNKGAGVQGACGQLRSRNLVALGATARAPLPSSRG